MLSDSITFRALEIINENPSIDVMDAVKTAIQEENKIIQELLDNKSERAVKLRKAICYTVFTHIHLNECLK